MRGRQELSSFSIIGMRGCDCRFTFTETCSTDTNDCLRRFVYLLTHERLKRDFTNSKELNQVCYYLLLIVALYGPALPTYLTTSNDDDETFKMIIRRLVDAETILSRGKTDKDCRVALSVEAIAESVLRTETMANFFKVIIHFLQLRIKEPITSNIYSFRQDTFG